MRGRGARGKEREGCVVIEAPDGRVLAEIVRAPAVAGYRALPRGAARERWTFHDTDLRSLARSGFSLGVRRAAGRREAVLAWSETASTPVLRERVLSAALPARFAGPPPIPEGALRDRLLPLAAGRPLEPVASASVSIRHLDLARVRGEGSLAGRLAVESWTVEGIGMSKAPLRLHVVRLRSATLRDDALAEAARRLEREFPLGATTRGDAERIFRALHGDAEFAEVPSGKPRPEDSLRTAARRVFSGQLQRLRRHDPGTREGSDPEDLHDMRVATRRLRAALRSYRPALTPDLHHALARDLRWLGRRLGAVRDVDVLLERFEGSGTLPAFLAHLGRRRDEARDRLLAALRSGRYLWLLSALDTVCRGWSIEAVPEAALYPVGAHAAAEARAARDRLVRDGDAALARPEAERLHRARIRAKRLRYVLEFHDELGGEGVRDSVRRLTALQDHLGAHQDAIVASDEIRKFLAKHGAVLAERARAGTEARLERLAAEAESLRRRFPGRWTRLRAAIAGERFEAILDRMDKKRGTPFRASPDLS